MKIEMMGNIYLANHYADLCRKIQDLVAQKDKAYGELESRFSKDKQDD